MNNSTLDRSTSSNFPASDPSDKMSSNRETQRQNIEDIYPLSPMQQGMLFHSLLTPNAGVYVPQITFALRGALDRIHLQKAWQTAISACSILRTSFHWEKRDQPFQVVRREVNLPWVEQDWQEFSAEVQAEKLAIFLECDRAQGFNLKSPPLMRLALIHCGEDNYQLIFSYHHLILDGWSAGNLIRTVFEQYFGQWSGQAPQAPTVSGKSLQVRPYGDYIAWLNQQDGPAAERYWRTYLQGFTEATPLPLEQRSGKAQRAGNTALQQQQLQLSEADTASLKAFAQQHQLTLNTLLQGAFALLLSRYSDRQDVLFGATCAGRPAELTGVESMIGLFINTLPVRVKLSPEMSLVPWLQQLQQERATASGYEYSALAQVQSLSELPAGNPLFRSLLVFENYPVDTSLLQQPAHQTDSKTAQDSVPTLAFDNLQFNEWTSFPLTLLVSAGTHLNLTIKYDLDCLSEAGASQLLHHLQTLLIEMSLKPEVSLAQLEMLSGQERQQLLTWSKAGSLEDGSHHLEHCLHHHFEAQVEKTPNQLAVRFGEAELSYQALNARANQLARHLQQLGVGPEVPVAVYLARSPELVITLLGILKAGGCYVPLDPDYPSERLAWMLEDVGTSHLITDSRQGLNPLSTLPSVSLLDLAQSSDLAQLSTDNLEGETHPQNSIYIIYTSGSTGRPKGVINTHRGVVNRLAWMQETYGLDGSDRVLQKTSFSFDVSVWEFFWPLLNGATLVLAKPGGHRDSAYLAQLIQQEQITTLHFVPSMLQAFLEVPDLALSCNSLKRVICSGEALSVGVKDQFFDCLSTELYNLYGPTEAAIDVTAWKCLPEQLGQTEESTSSLASEAALAQSVPIGYPIANTQIYLLDSQHRPVPQGCAGEICIGGVGLARGYGNRPDLTAERFIPNPLFASANTHQQGSFIPFSESAYLYRTGDLARYRPDGALDYLGRMDQQVKLRGFRIEMGEIEARLTQHSNVKQSVVLLRADNPTTPQLVAYVVLAEAETELEASLKAQLQSWLAQSLPDYMVPTTFISLEALPLTANGKLNRRALPAPDAPSSAQRVPPRNKTERAIAEIWQALLQRDAISIHDNFFELGGHSLMATRANSRLQSTFDLELPLQTIFERPTIAGLAARIEALTLAQSMAQSTAQSKQDSPPDPPIHDPQPGTAASASPPLPDSSLPKPTHPPSQPRRKEIEL